MHHLPLAALVVFSLFVMFMSSGIRPWYSQRAYIQSMWLCGITVFLVLRLVFLAVRGFSSGSFYEFRETLVWLAWFLGIYVLLPCLFMWLGERSRRRVQPTEDLLTVTPPVVAPTPPRRVGPPPQTCPQCSRILRRRSGRFGAFWGCSGYPKCTFTQSIIARPHKRPTTSSRVGLRQKRCG